jgi:septin family protein
MLGQESLGFFIMANPRIPENHGERIHGESTDWGIMEIQNITHMLRPLVLM